MMVALKVVGVSKGRALWLLLVMFALVTPATGQQACQPLTTETTPQCPRGHPKGKTQDQPPKSVARNRDDNFYLKAGRLYEEFRLWKQAELQYLNAGKDPSSSVQQQALEGLRRVRDQQEAAAREDFHLRAGELYESFHLWKQAELNYIAVGSDSPITTQRSALDGLSRVRTHQHPLVTQLGEHFDTVVPFLLKILGALLGIGTLAILGLATVEELNRAYQRVEVKPFDTSGDQQFAGHIAVTFSRLTAKMSAAFSTSQVHYFIGGFVPRVTPDWRESFPNLSIEAGTFKLSNIAAFVNFLSRPKVRIIGGAQIASNRALVYAEVWKRRWWFRYKLEGGCARIVTHPVYFQGMAELETFVYDVFLRIYATR